jgi:hypothetical protein
MGFLLDQKHNLGRYMIPNGPGFTVTCFEEFAVIPSGSTVNQFAVFADGTIQLGDGDDNTYNNIIISGGITTNFKQITDTGTDYLLTNNDYAVEIISATYNSVTLPAAAGIGGRTYVISRGSTNNNLIVKSQIGDTIDGRTQIALKRINDHMQVQSNGINEWYMM